MFCTATLGGQIIKIIYEKDNILIFTIRNVKGSKLTTKKSIAAKEGIKKYSKDFNGTLKDTEVMKLVGISRNSYYKYKRELIED